MIALAATAMILLAHGDEWVMFDVCQIDTQTIPPKMTRSRDHQTFALRKRNIGAIRPVASNAEGLDCVQIATTTGRHTIYVIGTMEEVMEKIR